MITPHITERFVIGMFIGSLIGLLLGVFVGSPLLGLLIGGIIGSRVTFGKRRSHIDISRKPDVKWIYISIPLILFIILLAYYFRPWLHGFLMAFYTLPSLVFLLILGGILAYALHRQSRIATIILAALMGFLFIILAANHILVQKSIVNHETYASIETLPDSEQVRLLPQAIAHRYLEDSLQKSRERVGGLDIIMINGTLSWTSPRIPDGGILYLTQPVNGLLIADATATTRNTRLLTKVMMVGEDIGVTDNVYWQIYKDQYFIDVDDVYYIVEGEEVFTIASIIGYEFRFPVMIPMFKGVYIIDSDGTLQWVEKDRIRDVPLLDGHKIYPESLARLFVDSYKYHLGWFNAVFLHKDQIEISDVYGQDNRQPFLMDTAQGLKWVIATEPYGKSYGVFKIFLVDAYDGSIEMLELDEDHTLTGPVRVVSYVKKKFPTIDWGAAKVVEPRPHIIDSELYWMLSITPNDFAGVSYTVLVNAANNEVFAFENDDELRAFLKGDRLPEDDRPENTIDAYVDQKTKDALREKIARIETEIDDLKRLLDE